jgi:hypothetical protein
MSSDHRQEAVDLFVALDRSRWPVSYRPPHLFRVELSKGDAKPTDQDRWNGVSCDPVAMIGGNFSVDSGRHTDEVRFNDLTKIICIPFPTFVKHTC